MTTIDFITELFLKVDDKLTEEDKNQKHAQAKLYPSEVVTLALLFAPQRGRHPRLLSVDRQQLQRTVPPFTPAHPVVPSVQQVSASHGVFHGGPFADRRD